MADIVSPGVRSRMMAGIRGKNTKPELLLRRGLHRLGFRFRLHDKKLPGNPDIVFAKYDAVIFVHGCFWHLHDCHLFRWPKSRERFWREKLQRNQALDRLAVNALRAMGWRYAIIWECAIKGRSRLHFPKILLRCKAWLESNQRRLEIKGKNP